MQKQRWILFIFDVPILGLKKKVNDSIVEDSVTLQIYRVFLKRISELGELVFIILL